jgi:5'-nucleotidase
VSEPTEWKASSPTPATLKTVKILGFNDFHGQLNPPPAIDGRPLGGAAVLASYLRAAAKGIEDSTLVVHAGDLIGASPPASALHQDEPTIEFFGASLGTGCSARDRAAESCRVVASLGNHEFDEGVNELRRVVLGGNHARGPFLGHAYAGAPFEYIGANVHDKQSGKPIVAPRVVKTLGGVQVGLVGAVLRQSPMVLKPSAIQSVTFEDEATAVNAQVQELTKLGVRTIIAVIHQGAFQCFAPGVPHDERSVAGPIVDIVKQLDAEVDLVVSGHTHSVLSALLANSGGKPTLVTQAFHAGTGFAEIELGVDSASGDVVSKRARIVTPWADVAPGTTPAPDIAQIVQEAELAVQGRTERTVGSVGSTLHAAPDAAGNSELGTVIADAQREASGADLAFALPSSGRGDIKAGSITWGDLFRIQPFGNRLMKVELTGKQVIALLNQQWANEDRPRILHVAGLTYRWDSTRPPADRIVSVARNGKPLEGKQRFTVVLNEYLAEGGDGFSVLSGVPRTPTPLLDVDALEQFLKKHSPLVVSEQKRIERVP